MILTDIKGNRVNAKHFTVELEESGSPQLHLMGFHTYVTKKDSVIINKQKKHVLEQCPCNEENIRKLLIKKEELEKLVLEIDKEMLQYMKTGEYDSYSLNEWMVNKGYKFYEEDEYHPDLSGDEFEESELVP